MTIERSTDWQSLARFMSPFSSEWKGFDPKSLIGDEDNVLLFDGTDNYGLFEFEEPGHYFGHYLFTSARGRSALTTARQMIDHFFTHYPALVISGQTPVDHRGAVWLNKQLGFIATGIEHTETGPCHRVFITKERFYK